MCISVIPFFCKGHAKDDLILLVAGNRRQTCLLSRGINVMILVKSKKRNLGGFVH